MRCQFCGWDNPEGKTSCEKCNKPLNTNTGNTYNVNTGNDSHSRPTSRQANVVSVGEFNPKKTVRESQIGMQETVQEKTNTCPQCGYELENGACPMCGYYANQSKTEQKHEHKDESAPNANMEFSAEDARKTTRPKRKGEKEKSFTLTPISEDTGLLEGNEIKYDGNNIVLNRDNTDPRNKTITSHGQASIHFANDKWTITDKSELKTTFVQAEDAIELKDGSIILLGNQLYRFNS